MEAQIIENKSINYPLPYTQLNDEQVHMLGYNLPMEAMHLVHPHWRGFPAPPFHYHLFMIIIYFCLMMSSFFGNGMVIWIFATSKSLRTPSNLFILNLALFDFVMMIEMPMFLVNSCYQMIVGFDMACNIYAALGSISGIGGTATNAAIAFDRYRTISNPLDGRLNFFQAGIIVFLTWLWTIPFTLSPFLKIWNRYIPEGFLTTCTFDYLTEDDDTKVFMATIFVWVYCIPMLIICYNYFNLFLHFRNFFLISSHDYIDLVIRSFFRTFLGLLSITIYTLKVKSHEKMLADQAKKMNVKSLSANQSNSSSVELRIAKAAFTIWFLYVCAWTPYAVVCLIGTFGNKELITPTASMIPAVTAKIVSCIDPWVYAISHPKYRIELEKRIPWLGIREKEIVSKNDTESAGTTAVSE